MAWVGNETLKELVKACPKNLRGHKNVWRKHQLPHMNNVVKREKDDNNVEMLNLMEIS